MFNFWRSKTPAPHAERKSLAVPDAALLQLFGATTGAAGITVTTQDALAVPAVAAAIRVISEAAASLDVGVKAVAPDGTETDARDHPVARFLRGSGPNPWTAWSELVADLVADALISDAGGIAHVSRTSDGRIVEVFRYRRGNVTIVRDLITDEPRYSIDNRPIPAASLIHVAPPLGRAPLSSARDAIGLAILLERHAVQLFKNGARPGGVITIPKAPGEEGLKKIIAAWRAAHETEGSSGKTAILIDGAEFKPLTFNSTDAQFLELRRFQLEEIARAFNIPAPMIGDLSRATWANLESKHREFWSTTLEPHLLALEGALRRGLFLPDEREKFAIRFDRDDFGRADLSARATSINGLIASRTISPNEGRAWLGMEPREGGDEFLNPNISTETAA